MLTCFVGTSRRRRLCLPFDSLTLVLSLAHLLSSSALPAPVTETDVHSSSLLVNPSRTDEIGNRVSYDLLPDGDEAYEGKTYRVRIDAFGKTYRLELTESGRKFLSDGHVVEYHHNRHGVRPGNYTSDCIHFTGSVLSEETSDEEGNVLDDDGWTAISYCGGLRGVIATRSSGYLYIRPEGEVPMTPHSQPHPHLLSSSSSSSSSHDSTCAYANTESFKSSRASLEKSMRVRRSPDSTHISSERWVEVAVVADHTMFQYHGAVEVQAYIFTLMNMVAHVYRHPSIGHAMNIVIVRTIILETQQAGPSVTSHALNSLNSFCSWQRTTAPLSSGGHDISLLITRNNLCEGFGGNCGTLGIAEFKGACSPGKSCAISEDIGLATAFTIAHELGHSLGIRHDGDMSVICEPDDHFIMAPTFAQSHNPHIWSHCSQQQLAQFLLSEQSSCLSNQPVMTGVNSSVGGVPLPGTETTPTEQCQLLLGNSATHCGLRNSSDFCSRLRCQIGNQSECTHRHIPPAAGTWCVLASSEGREGVCYEGSCVELSSITRPVDGGWGEWDEWEPCSLTCGTGIQGSSRVCNSPRPANGGRYCLGASHRHRTCNSAPCHAHSDIRQELCDTEPPHTRYNQWLAPSLEYLQRMNLDQCSHHCLSQPHNTLFSLDLDLPDGTSCLYTTQPPTSHSLHSSPVPESPGVCVSGECIPIGCDSTLYSMSSRDDCGVWCGNGSTCVPVSDTYTLPNISSTETGNYAYHRMMTIPRGSGQVTISELDLSPNLYLAASTTTESFNGNYRVKSGSLGSYWFAGVLWWYERPTNDIECLRTSGILKDDITIFVISDTRNVTIRYSAGLPPENASAILGVDYEWRVVGEWGRCDGVCGGEGVRRREVECVASGSELAVINELCDLTIKPLEEESCQSFEGCVYEWRGAQWSNCNTTCGVGEITRTINCFLTNSNLTLVDEVHCQNQTPPATSEECEVLEACVYQWNTSDWSECSSVCGEGQRQRDVSCIQVNTLATVDHDKCDEIIHPNSYEDCYSELGCVFEWKVGEWGNCSATCGGGERQRTVFCVVTSNGSVVSDSLCWENSAPRPINYTHCHAHEGCTYEWVSGAWSQCSEVCGAGNLSRDMWCQLTSNGTRVGEEECEEEEEEKPETEKECYSDSGCVFVWRTTDWSDCSSECGLGNMTRNIYCFLTNNHSTVPDHNCPSQSKPLSQETCYSERGCQFAWTYPEWGNCSTICGGGEKQREVSCTLTNNITTVDDGHCLVSATKPATIAACGKSKCLYEWRRGDWGVCEFPSGGSIIAQCNEGQRRWRIECILTNNQSVVDVRHCSELETPDEVSNCTVPGCHYVWSLGNWSRCDAPCGEGLRQREVHCQQRLGESGLVRRRVEEEERCGGNRPALRESCSSEPCSNYNWNKGVWSECTAECNQQGSQTRTVNCKHTTNSVVVPDNPYCTSSSHVPKPVTTKTCTGEPCLEEPEEILCVDNYRSSCGVVLRLHLCHVDYLRENCCHSCSS